MNTVRLAGRAATATVPNEEMGKEGPILAGHDFDQGLLYFDGIVLAGEGHSAAEPAHMGIDHDSLGQMKGVAQDNIGRFPAYPGQFVEMLHGSGNLPAVIPGQGRRATADGLGLGTKKSGCADQALQLGSGDFGEVPGGVAAGEQGRGDLVDPLVGALGGQDGGHEELEGVGVVKLAVRVWVGTLEFGNDPASSAS